MTHHITLIRLSEARSEACRVLYRPAPRRPQEAEMVWDCFSVATIRPVSHWNRCGLWITHPSMKGHLGQVKTSQPPTLPVPSSAFYLTHCCSGSSGRSFVIRFSAGEMQSSSERGKEEVITMGCLSWWEWGSGCGWKTRMIGCFWKWFVWKTTEAACTWGW